MLRRLITSAFQYAKTRSLILLIANIRWFMLCFLKFMVFFILLGPILGLSCLSLYVGGLET